MLQIWSSKNCVQYGLEAEQAAGARGYMVWWYKKQMWNMQTWEKTDLNCWSARRDATFTAPQKKSPGFAESCNNQLINQLISRLSWCVAFLRLKKYLVYVVIVRIEKNHVLIVVCLESALLAQIHTVLVPILTGTVTASTTPSYWS